MDFFKIFKRNYFKNDQAEELMKILDKKDVDFAIEEKSRKKKNFNEKYFLKENQKVEKLHSAEKLLETTISQISTFELTSFSTFPDVNEVEGKELTQFYEKYYKNKPKFENKLVINKYKIKILSMIKLNKITIITGLTGCGKTTHVPQFLLNSYAKKNKHCNILVSQPSEIAAISISKKVCEERNWTLGTICGYKIGLKDCTSEDTRLTYASVEVFLQMIINSKNLNDYTHVILDEVHKRDQNMDFALLMVKKLLSTNTRNVKVILMSATADVGKFASYFEKRISGKLQPAPVISTGRTSNYVVQTHYLEELFFLGELPDIRFHNPFVSDIAMMTCVKLIKHFERLDEDKMNKKSVLVFLPGVYEIEELFSRLMDPEIYNAGIVEYKWFPVQLHSSMTAEEQELIFCSPPIRHRKIILATNIAESSLTVPDVMFVIDFCLTKVLITDTVSNCKSFQLSWASQAECIQRAGRVGRIMEGRVYRMVYKKFYQTLPKQSVPDMLRCPLEKVVLQSKLLNMGSPEAILALTLDPPDLSNIERAVLTLKEVGGLLLTSNGIASSYDGDLTYLGRLMALMPVDIRITRLIVLGYLYSCLEECIVMGAAMSVKNVLISRFQSSLKAYSSKLEWADGSCSDCIAFLNVYNVWRMNHAKKIFERSIKYDEVDWAKRHFIQLQTLKEIHILADELTGILKKHNIEKTSETERVQWNDVQKAFVLKFVIAGAFYPNYFCRGARGGQINEEAAVKALGGRDPFTTVYLQNYPREQPSELYSHLIKEKLVECREDMTLFYDNSRFEDFSIASMSAKIFLAFDCSKVYVEFRKQELNSEASDTSFNSKIPGKISLAVYRAVKMRQTLKNVEIKAMPPYRANAVAVKLGIKKKNDLFSTHSSRDVSVKEKMFQSIIPGVDLNFILLNITHVIDPGHFWAVSNDGMHDRCEREIHEMLNCEKAELESYSKIPDLGEMCVAPYKYEGKVGLYRARIDALTLEENKWFAQVFFIDYGYTELVSVSELLKYKPKLLSLIGKIPAQCFECVLTRIKPSLMKHPSGKWCEAAKLEFQKLIQNGDLVGSIYSVVGEVVSLVLYKVADCGTINRQININQHLVKEGYAEEIEESYLSKVQENCLEKSFRPDLHNCTLTLKLEGPYSPLEMEIFSYCRAKLLEHVIVSPCSVNSVLLDNDPQDPHEILIVAAHVNQDQMRTNLTLHHTTILPNIHGLAALVPFVFAPTAELRVNEERTKYTGFLCGLGRDENNRAMFPEHDMEMVFDCEFTLEDFSTVNELRFFMSTLLRTSGDKIEPIHSYSDIVMYQNKIKDLFTKLINKHRPSQGLKFPNKSFEWGLEHSNLIVSNETTLRCNKQLIFPLHVRVPVTPDPDEQKKSYDSSMIFEQ